MKNVLFICFLLAAMGMFSKAQAEEIFVPRIIFGEVHPCQADAEIFCKKIKPGHGRLRKCLKKHKSEISQGCQTKLKEAAKQFRKLKKECKKDIKLYCSEGVDKERGSMIQCLTRHQNVISTSCWEECQKKF